MAGVAVVVVVLRSCRSTSPSAFVFTQTIDNSGFSGVGFGSSSPSA